MIRRSLLAYTALGLVATLTISVGGAIFSSAPFWSSNPIELPPNYRERPRWLGAGPAAARVFASDDLFRRQVQMIFEFPHPRNPAYINVFTDSFGWPLKALSYVTIGESYKLKPYFDESEAHRARTSEFEHAARFRAPKTISWWVFNINGRGNERLVPVFPMPFGLVGDTLFFAAAFKLAVLLPAFLFRWCQSKLRARNGLCTKCGYELHDLPRCPECGHQPLSKPDPVASVS